MYFNGNEILTYNCLFNFIVGSRGCGKTYWAKKWAIKDFLKTKSQFIYVRRYKQELKRIAQFWNDIRDEFPDHKLTVDHGKFYINGELAGFTLPLSTSKIEKSTAFPEVNKIIFDEFILDSGVYRYLSDEVTNFLELYETVARMRDVTVFFLSNAITVANPYFIYFDINLRNGFYRHNDVLAKMVNNKEFIEQKSKTRFGQLIGDTPYGKYAIENEFLRDNENFVMKKTPDAKYMFGFIFEGMTFGVWISYKYGLYFVSEKFDPSNRIMYTIKLADHNPNTLLLKGAKRSPLFKPFIENFKIGNVRFETTKVQSIVKEVIKLTL